MNAIPTPTPAGGARQGVPGIDTRLLTPRSLSDGYHTSGRVNGDRAMAMKPVRTLIVDDEPLCRQRLRTLLEADPEVAVVGECADGSEAAAELKRGKCDLVFLDIQ